MRPNERFTGRGHARHLCKDCAKLGQEELAYRQAVRNIERLIRDPEGFVPRKKRRQLEPFLSHPDERVRRYAEEVARTDAEACAAYRRAREEEERELETLF